MSARRILALDLATRTGWAHLDTVDGAIKRSSGFVQFGREKALEHPGVMWFRARAWFREQLTREVAHVRMRRADVVYFEEPQTFKNRAATEMAYGLKTILEDVCCDLGIPVSRVNPATLKKHATGNGRANKEQVCAAAVERLAWTGTDHNEADALWVLDIARLTEAGTWVPHAKRKPKGKKK